MRFLDSIDRDAIAGPLARDEYFWLDLTDPGADREGVELEEAHAFLSGGYLTNVDSAAAFFALGIGSLVLSVVGLLAWFRRGSYI